MRCMQLPNHVKTLPARVVYWHETLVPLVDMDTSSEPHGIGVEVRRLRKWRGMTLDALAGQAGLTKGYLSRVENGHVALERRTTLAKIAGALRVSVADLTGYHYISDRADSDAHSAIPDIRLALSSSTLEVPHGRPSRPIEALVAEADRLAALRAKCRDVEVGHALPALLTDLHAAATIDNNDRLPALRSLVQATNSTTHLLKTLGAVDLALIASDRGYQAAVQLDDPLYVAASNYVRAQALIGLGAYQRADAVARQSVEMLTPDSPAANEVYGINVLATAFCGAQFGVDPEEALREAQGAAERFESTNVFWLNFSRSNVNQWRLAIALEAGEHAKAAEIAEQIDPDEIPSTSRRLIFFIDHARALHALRGRDDQVVQLLRQAEKLGATRARNNIWGREIVAEMLFRSRRDAGGRELRGLADRMGMLHPV